MIEEIGSIRMKDLEMFSEVGRAKSIREVARRLNVTSGQVSKAIQQLERRMNAKLFKRSVSGMLLTQQGSDLMVIAQKILENGQLIEDLVSGDSKKSFSRLLAIAGTSFLNTHFTTPTIVKNASELPNVTFRFLDLAPDQLIPVGLRGGFEMAVHYGALSWPNTWVSRVIGKSSWVLCCRADLDLPKKPALKHVLEFPFVVPTYWTSEGLTRGNDQFPIAISKRKLGYETATADAAIPILLNSDHLAFLPDILVHPFVEQKLLREIDLDEIQKVEKSLYLSARSDSVTKNVFEKIVEKLKNSI